TGNSAPCPARPAPSPTISASPSKFAVRPAFPQKQTRAKPHKAPPKIKSQLFCGTGVLSKQLVLTVQLSSDGLDRSLTRDPKGEAAESSVPPFCFPSLARSLRSPCAPTAPPGESAAVTPGSPA